MLMPAAAPTPHVHRSHSHLERDLLLVRDLLRCPVGVELKDCPVQQVVHARSWGGLCQPTVPLVALVVTSTATAAAAAAAAAAAVLSGHSSDEQLSKAAQAPPLYYLPAYTYACGVRALSYHPDVLHFAPCTRLLHLEHRASLCFRHIVVRRMSVEGVTWL
jgi:hypothetical protein